MTFDIRGPKIQIYGQTQTVTKFRYLLDLTDLSWQLSGILCWDWRATDKDTYKAVSDTARRKTCHTKYLNAFVAPAQSRGDEQETLRLRMARDHSHKGPEMALNSGSNSGASEAPPRRVHAQICTSVQICEARCGVGAGGLVAHKHIKCSVRHVDVQSYRNRRTTGLHRNKKRWRIWL